jgi:CMP/dCMP kinase
MRLRPVVAIDGPAGAGKSTVARGVARELGFALVDTGSLYRAVALLAKEQHIDFAAQEAIEHIARESVASGVLRLGRDEHNGTQVLIRGANPGDSIRTPDIALGASTVSAHPGVRDALLDAQRFFGTDGGVVLEGRDIGTVVFPDAEVKIFLTASPEVRAHRRYDEFVSKGVVTSYEATLDDVKKRDAQDAGRSVAPLRQAEDAVLVDSRDMDAEAVITQIVAITRQRTAR